VDAIFNESSASEQPNKAIIQTKIAEYQRNLTYAKRQATRLSSENLSWLTSFQKPRFHASLEHLHKKRRRRCNQTKRCFKPQSNVELVERL